MFSPLDQFKITPIFIFNFFGMVYGAPFRLFPRYEFSQMHVNSFSFKKITSLPGVDVKTFFNNLITTSSFLITPPKSFGKISMFSWFVDQYYEESLFMICFILAEILMLVIALLGFLAIYIVYKKDNFFVNEFLPYFKKLSPMKKLILGSFTIFTAIPNKFWINVNIHFIVVFMISAVTYCLGLIIPLLFFCHVTYFILCLESLIFGLLYDYSDYFKKLVNSLLFNSPDDPFAADYFYWFWGNTWQKAARKAGPLVAGVTAIAAKRQQENREKIEYADKSIHQIVFSTKEKFKDANEMSKFQKMKRDEWIYENGTVTKAIKFAENLWNVS